MSDQAPDLPGVLFGRLRRHADVRGGFAEAWRARGSADTEPFPAVQANLSLSAKGVLRGLHLHQRQSDLWVVVSGIAFVALVDVRPMLAGPAAGPGVQTQTLEKDETVTIPPGVAHGFLAVEPLELLYFVTNEYDASDELGFAWDDPQAAVPWPTVGTPDVRPILSDRDRRNPALSELVATLSS
jgi:dTDP-4-dehydrorhamnose 3,5-epimerase